MNLGSTLSAPRWVVKGINKRPPKITSLLTKIKMAEKNSAILLNVYDSVYVMGVSGIVILLADFALVFT